MTYSTSVSCVTTLLFINSVPWPHGIVKVSIECTVQNPGGSFEYSEYGHTP